MTIDWERLIPELKEWSTPLTPEQWIQSAGDYQLSVAYSALFWPQFTEVEGMVFHEGISIEAVHHWLATTQSDRKATEATLNHIHILHLHGPDMWLEATREQIIHLGRTLKEIYETKLKRDFPSKIFVVEFDESPQESLTDYQLIWYQKPD